MALRFTSVSFRRNGVSGNSYFVAKFRDRSWNKGRDALTAIVFDGEGDIAITDQDGNSWRPEDYEREVREFIRSPLGEAMCWPHEHAPANAA